MRAEFDGETFDRARDQKRLTSQLDRVKAILDDGKWHDMDEITKREWIMSGKPRRASWASLSARIRDLRKPKFGGLDIESDCVEAGLWRFRIVPNEVQLELLKWG